MKGCYFSLVLQREWIWGWRLITLFHGHGEYRHISLGPVEYFWLALTVIFPACWTKYATSCNIVQVCACSVIDMNEQDRPLWKSMVAPVSKHLPSWTRQNFLQTLNSNVNLGWRRVVFFYLFVCCCFSCTARCRVTRFCTHNPDLWITKDCMQTPSLQHWCHQLAMFNFLLRQKLSLGWSAGASAPPTPPPTLWVQGSVRLDSRVWWIKPCSDGGEAIAFVCHGDG